MSQLLIYVKFQNLNAVSKVKSHFAQSGAYNIKKLIHAYPNIVITRTVCPVQLLPCVIIPFSIKIFF